VDLATIAQLAAATANISLTVVFGVGYYVFLKQNRAMLEHNREMLSEMRASSTARGRPKSSSRRVTPTCLWSTSSFPTSAEVLHRT
jgi:hypothetical protein